MAKAKKAARKAPKRQRAIAPQPPTIPGRKFATVRALTLPVLALKIEVPAYVTLRAPKPRRDPDGPFLAEVMELESATVMELQIPEKLLAVFTANYPGDKAEGKSFCIIRHARHDRKNEFGYTVEEIDPGKPTQTGGE